MTRIAFLFLLTFCVTPLIIAQSYKPHEALKDVMEEQGQGVTFQKFIDQEREKLFEIEKILNGNISDTFFDIGQLRLYEFLKNFISKQDSLPLSTFPSEKFADFAVNYMRDLEAQRQVAEVIYDHVKHEVAELLKPKQADRNSRYILESLEVLARASVRFVVEHNEILDINGIVKYMDNPDVRKIILGLAQVQNNAKLMDFTKLESNINVDWLGNDEMKLISKLSKSFEKLMHPIEIKRPYHFHTHLLALDTFHSAYTKLLSLAFDTFLETRWKNNNDFSVSDTMPLNAVQGKWNIIKTNREDIALEDALISLQSEMIEDYFKFRVLLRDDLNLFSDSDTFITVLSVNKISQLFEELAGKWNDNLADTRINLDTTRQSLGKLVSLAISKDNYDLLGQQLLRLDSLYLGSILREMNWEISQLDSLVISTEEKQKLEDLISQTVNHFNQLQTIIKDPGVLSEELEKYFKLGPEWKGSDSIRYVLYERLPLDTSSTTFGIRIPTGITTPWIEISKECWSKKDSIFDEDWKTLVSQIELQVNDELEKWLRYYGFPGSISLDNQNLSVRGGIHFRWLGRHWELVLGEKKETINTDTIRITFGEIKNPDFWEEKSRDIVKEEWTKAKSNHEQEIQKYWELILADIEIALPEDLKGVLRGDTLIYSYDIGDLKPELSGARIDFKWSDYKWNLSYNIPNVVLLERLSSLLPQIEFKNSTDSQSGFRSDLWVNISSEPTLLGTFEISKRGQIELIDLNGSRVDITLGNDIQIRLISPKYENNIWKWDFMTFQNYPTHLLFLNDFNNEVGLKIELLPNFHISIDYQHDSIKEKLLQHVTSILNTRGLMPPGVMVEDVVIDKGGIFPKLKIGPDLQSVYHQQVSGLISNIEELALQTIHHPELVEIGKNIEAFYEEFEHVISNENINWLIRILNDPFDQVATDALINIAMSNNNIVKFSKDLELKITFSNNQINEIGIIHKHLVCDNKSILDLIVQNNLWTPNDDQVCIQNQVRRMLADDNIILNSKHINISADQKKIIVTINANDIPLEMYLFFDGKIGWNYSKDQVANVILDPYRREIEANAKKLLDELEIEVKGSLATAAYELFDQWENAINKLGFEIENERQLRQKLGSLNTISDLYEMTLYAKLKATSGLIEGITIENVKLRVANGLVPDFSACTANLSPIRKKVNKWAGNIVELKDDPELKKGIIASSLTLKIPGFSDIPILLSIDLSKGNVDLVDWKDVLIIAINNELNNKLLPYSLKNENVSITLENSEVLSAPRNKEIKVKCILNFSTGTAFDVPINAFFTINFKSGVVSIDLENPDLKSLFLGVAGNLISFLSVPFLEENQWLPNVELYPPSGLPQGVIFSGEFPIWGIAKIEIPNLLISQRGIRFQENDGIKINFGGIRTLVPPIFELIEPSGEIQGTNLLFSAKLTFHSNFEDLIYTKGSFLVDLKKPLRWETRNEVIALQMFNLGNSRQVIDLGNGTYEMEIDLGGPLKDIIALKGKGRVEGVPPVIYADGDLFFFGEKMARGDLSMNLANQTITANSKIDIPIAGNIDAHFSTSRNFSNPTISASHSLKVLRYRLSNTEFLISPNIASAKFSVVGISMGLQVPSYKQLDKNAFERLLKNLLSPDFSNLDEALFAILSGNITINPFSGFGPGGGGIGGDGGDGAGSSGGTNGNGGTGVDGNGGYDSAGGVQSKTSDDGKAASAGTIQRKLIGEIPNLEQPVSETQGNGTTPALIKGDYSFKLKKVGNNYRVFMSNSQSPDTEEPKSFIGAEFINKNHFVSMDDGSYRSAGYFLNATDKYYVQILKQKMNGSSCGENNAVMHWYVGERPGELKHFQMPLDDLKATFKDLDLCFNKIETALRDYPALGRWMQGFSSAVGNRAFDLNSDRLIAQGDENLFKFHAPEGTYAVAIRFYNTLNHTLIIGYHDNWELLKVQNLNLIKDNNNAQAELLKLAKKHAHSGLNLYESGGNVYLYTGCDPTQKMEITYILVGNSFVVDDGKLEPCDPEVDLPDPEPTPIEKEPGIPIRTDLVGPGNCALELIHEKGYIGLKCSSNPSPFAFAPVMHESYTLFKANGSQWLLNDPHAQIWKLQYGLTRYLINEGEAVLWVQGDTSNYNISLLPFGKHDIPGWEKLNPSSFDQNVALQGAFNQLCTQIETFLPFGNKINKQSIQFKADEDISVFVVQFTERAETEYWVFAGNAGTKKSITLRITSEAGSPMDFRDAFFNHIKTATQ